MLESIRKRSGSIVVKGLLLLLVLSFAVWGIGDMVTPNLENMPVAEVGEIEIPGQQLHYEVQGQVQRLRQATGQTLDSEQIRQMAIPYSVLNQIIARTLYLQGANELGLLVGDDQIREAIREIDAFKGPFGKFDRQTFEQVLYSQGLNEARFVDMLRGDIARAQYLSAVNSAAAPKAMAEILYALREERRVAETLRIAASAVEDVPAPTDEQLSTYHQDHRIRYTAPEYRELTVVTLKAGDLAGDMVVADEEIQELFESRSDEFVTPEQRTIYQIRVDSKEEADRAHELLGQGRDFAEVAMDVAGMDEKATLMGTTTREMLLDELQDAAFTLANGAFSVPIESPLGWHVIRVLGIERGREQTLEEVSDDLRKELANEKALGAIFELGNSLEDTLAGGATLEEAAGLLGVKAVKVASIDGTGMDVDGKPVEDVPQGPRFLKTAFDTPEGQESPLTDVGDDAYFVVRPDGVTAPALRPLDTIRDKVTQDWTRDEKKTAAVKKAEELAGKIKGGVALASLAGEMGLEVETTDAFTRTDGRSRLPAGVVSDLFAAEKGEAVSGGDEVAAFVAVLTEVRRADPTSDKAGVDTVRDKVGSEIGGDLLAQLGVALRKRYPVQVNNRAIQELF